MREVNALSTHICQAVKNEDDILPNRRYVAEKKNLFFKHYGVWTDKCLFFLMETHLSKHGSVVVIVLEFVSMTCLFVCVCEYVFLILYRLFFSPTMIRFCSHNYSPNKTKSQPAMRVSTVLEH